MTSTLMFYFLVTSLVVLFIILVVWVSTLYDRIATLTANLASEKHEQGKGRTVLDFAEKDKVTAQSRVMALTEALNIKTAQHQKLSDDHLELNAANRRLADNLLVIENQLRKQTPKKRVRRKPPKL